MEAKSKITAFFQPVQKTKINEDNEENDSSLDNQVTQIKRKQEDSDIENSELIKRPRLNDYTSPVKESPLSPEQKEKCGQNKLKAKILQLSKKLPIITPTIGQTWYSALSEVFGKDWFAKLSDFVCNERGKHTVYPDQKEVWEWTKRTRIEQTRVVILGQDPYHGPGQAHGLCFSVKPGIAPPPSLVNIFKELESDIEGFQKPKHGCLVGWADQGVLLLNAVLTVRRGEANSHKDRGWEKLTDAVISWISKNLSGVVFLLWGTPAQKKASMVDKAKHHLLKCVHPSPLSAYRGFLGCKHFSKCNELLEKQGKPPINWNHLPEL